MAQKESPPLNGDQVAPSEGDEKNDENMENSTASNNKDDDEEMKQQQQEPDNIENGSEQQHEVEEKKEELPAQESVDTPIIIDDLTELGIEWMLVKNEEGIGNWGKEYETSECLENVDDGQLDVETPPAMPDVKVTSHGQTMHLVPLKDNGRTSTTMTWIRKTALRKDSASDRRITIRGLSLGDLFHPRIYTLVQMAQAVEYSSTDRTTANSCSAGILTINFRTILDRVVALRRYLLDIEIPGRRLEIVCTFPDHKRPPEFETLWKAYEIEGVPPCSSQRADREILAKQFVIKNLPGSCNEEEIRKRIGNVCDEVEFVDDYKGDRCAIVTFVDITACHVAHARQQEIIFEDGTKPDVHLMTEMVVNTKLMPKKEKQESEEERHLRHTFEVLWNHQQKVANAIHVHERYGGGRTMVDYLPRKTFQAVTRKLPNDVKQLIETRVNERKDKEAAEKQKQLTAAQEEALKDQQASAKTEQDAKGEKEDAAVVKADTTESAPAPAKRQADVSPEDQSANKRPRKKFFRGAASGGGAGVGSQRRGIMSTSGGGFNRREQLVQQYQRVENRGYMQPLRRGAGGPPSLASPPGGGRYAGRGYSNEIRASPWIVPPGASPGASFDRRMDVAAGYGGSPASLIQRREPPPPFDQGGGGAPLFGGHGGMPYSGQVGYMTREMEMQRGGGGDLYQRRDSLGPDFQRTDYRGFYGKQ